MTGFEWALFLALGALWGSSFMWIKIAIADVGPLVLVSWRLAFALVGMVIVLAFRRPPWPAGWRTWRNLAFLGLINLVIPFALISWGELTIDSAVASVLNSTLPLFTLLIAHFALDDDRITPERVVGLAMGFAGVLLLMSRDLVAGEPTGALLGQLAVLAGALFYGIAGVYARRNFQRVDPMVQAGVPIFAGQLMILPLALAFEPGRLLPTLPITWVSLAWLGVMGSCVPFLLFYVLLHRIGPTRTSLVTYLIAVFGVLLGVIFLGERLDARLAIGTAIVLAGIAVVNRPRRRQVAPAG